MFDHIIDKHTHTVCISSRVKPIFVPEKKMGNKWDYKKGKKWNNQMTITKWVNTSINVTDSRKKRNKTKKGKKCKSTKLIFIHWKNCIQTFTVINNLQSRGSERSTFWLLLLLLLYYFTSIYIYIQFWRQIVLEMKYQEFIKWIVSNEVRHTWRVLTSIWS